MRKRLNEDHTETCFVPSGTHDKEGTRVDVSASDWSDWSASEETRILYADQSGADTSAFVSSYHVSLVICLDQYIIKVKIVGRTSR
ncbi:hypothetical protein Tco_0652088 [Tanacetum coccineum]|uniref:Uncharacterized protein n=1 Tax=Tanacetum coccineum TaxID=301880 RepID=A0ABQ4WWL5_9ASTR